ncbi:MAG: hypothetical protein IJ171_01835 [Ruminococcus sp.]|nr:hypothetical protein [Ruminococcus sp.]
MPGRTSKYSEKTNGEIKIALFEALEQAGEYDNPTISWIQDHSIYLSGFTSQKLSRSLNELVEMGLVKKGKNKAGRMVYRLMSQVVDMGISLEEDD